MSEGLLLSDQDKQDILKLFNGMKGMYTQLDTDLKAGKPVGEIKTQIDKATADIVAVQEKYTALALRTDAAEVKAADLLRRLQAGPEMPKGLGASVMADEAFKTYLQSPPPRVAYTVVLKGKTIAEFLAAKVITGVGVNFPQIIPGFPAIPPRPPIGVRPLFPSGRTSASLIDYVEETSFTNLAATVAEGAAKPQSTKTYTPKSAPVRTIAHYFKVGKQSLADAQGLEANIENNGIYGIQVVEDGQLLDGDGTGTNLTGINKNAVAAPAPAPATGATLIDAIGTAYFDLASKGFLPDGTVVNPADWGHVSLLKNSLGNYLFANPVDYSAIQRIWGMRLAQSANQVAGTFTVGAFQGNSLLLDREDVNVQVATQNEDDFIKNIVTILIEERLALLIYQPTAFEKGVVPAGT